MNKTLSYIAVSVLTIFVVLAVYKSNTHKELSEKEKQEIHMEALRRADSITNAIEEKVRLEQEMKNRVEAYRDSIQIIKYYTSDPNSAGGVDFNIVWKNNTKQTIKYIRWSVSAINAVDDEVYSTIGVYNVPKTVKETGPIKPGRTSGYGTYWENVWYNHSIRKSKLRKCEIEFMDGNKVSFTL